MLYTIGNRPNYLASFRKMALTNGRIDKSVGGYAVRTIAEARRLRAEEIEPGKDMAVFGMDADWEADTEPAPGGWWHLVTRPARLCLLDPEGRPIEMPASPDAPDPEVCRA